MTLSRDHINHKQVNASPTKDQIIKLEVTRACLILTTCSSRESGDSTRTSRSSRKTMVTSGSICSSRDMVFFGEIK